MDTERQIIKIESESLNTKQFDDLYIGMEDGISYRIQAKNYAGTQIEDIITTDHIVKIKTNENQYENTDNNVLIVNTDRIVTDIEFMGLPAVNKDGIVIIPLTEEQVTEYLDEFYQTEERELQIIQKAIEFTCAERFTVGISDLPELITLSTDLQHQTIILRKVPECIKQGITFYVGKPGVGKSHFVDELKNELITLSTDLQHQTIILRKVPECIKQGITFYVGKPGVGKSHFVDELKNTLQDSIVYRFWIGPQDEQLRRRLQFDKFLTELGLLIYKTPRSFTVDELIEEKIYRIH